MSKTLAPLLAEASANIARTGILSLLGPLADEVLAKADLEELAAGQMLFRQGEVGNCAYVLLEGGLDVLVDTGAGEVRAAEVAPNELIGEIAVFSQSPRTATVVARRPSKLLRIDAEDLLSVLNSSPQAAQAIIADLGRRLAAANQPLAFFSMAANALQNKDARPEDLEALLVRADDLGPFALAFREMVGQIEANHRQRQEMAMARHIQQAVLPRPLGPGLPLDLEAYMRPMREVGGDLYDFFRLDNGRRRLAIAIGDVSGKGVPASLFMMMCRTVLRTVAGAGLEVERCIRRVNEVLAEDNDLCVFVTLFFGVLDIDSGRLSYCNAGHNPPLVLRAAGGLETLAATGPAAAVMPGADYRAASVDLAPGDLLFLFTDGVTEALSASGELFGEQRLEELLRAHRANGPAAAVAAMVAAVDGFAQGVEQFDDITCLALSMRPGGQPSETPPGPR
jgi:Serine phosphatase RsbU, regulator of sigma subunit